MFDFLKNLVGEQSPVERTKIDDRVALAALLVEAALQDDAYEPAEKVAIERVLTAEFGLDSDASKALRQKAETAQADSVGIFRFTKAIKDARPFEERVAVIERLWEIALADAERDPNEDALIRKVCGLIGVSDQDSGLARQRVQARVS